MWCQQWQVQNLGLFTKRFELFSFKLFLEGSLSSKLGFFFCWEINFED